MITVDRKDITKALKKVASVARVTSHKAPVMGEASEGSLKLWYSSFNLSIWESLDVEEIDAELTFSCPVETLTSLVSSWSSDTVTLESGDNNTLIIRSGRSNVTVPYYEGIFDDIEELVHIRVWALAPLLTRTIREHDDVLCHDMPPWSSSLLRRSGRAP